jgi:hypothetical protein
MKRVGAGSGKEVVAYHCWRLPDEFIDELARLGETIDSSRPFYRIFTNDHPIDAELLDRLMSAAGDEQFVILIEMTSGSIQFVFVVDREWSRRPTAIQT